MGVDYIVIGKCDGCGEDICSGDWYYENADYTVHDDEECIRALLMDKLFFKEMKGGRNNGGAI